METILVKKASGEYAPFDEQKVRASMERIHIEPQVIDAVLGVVKKGLKPKMTTKEIYEIVKTELEQRAPKISARYRLRSALVRLGPAGFNFEKYVASILTAYGYNTSLPAELEGACVTHEVDVIAEKDGRRMFIEAKFRNQFEDTVNIKDTMATWSRYLDLIEGSKLGLCPHFDEAWIVTNARFTDHSLKYGHCKNMVMIGWNHPKERSFAKMVDLSYLYPVTILDDLTDRELEIFAKEHLMLCQEIAEQDPKELSSKTGLPQKRLKELIKACTLIIQE